MKQAAKRMIPLGGTAITEEEAVDYIVALQECIQAHTASMEDPECDEQWQGRIVERRNTLKSLACLLSYGLKSMTEFNEMETENPHGIPLRIEVTYYDQRRSPQE